MVDLNAALDVDVIRADLARRGRVSDNIGRTVMRLAGGDAAGWNAVPADDAAAVAAFLLHRVQERCMDTANDRIRRIAPLFQTRSYEYERQKFQERVGDGLETPIARRWVQRPVGETAHARAFASLVAGAGALNLATLPETLVHDIDRVEGFRNEFAAILRAAFEAAVARRAAPGTPAFRALALVYAEPAHPAHRLLRGAMRRRFLRATPPLPAFVDAERFDALARDVEAVRALDFNVHSAAYH